jgi:conjugal transfer pilus assembly protein TraU
MSLGPAQLWPSARPDAEGNPSIPICLCGGIPPRPGLAFGFWEPVRMIDVTTKAFCFPNLGGVKINPGLALGNGYVKARKLSAGIGEHTANYQVHYYVFPLFYLLELLNDFLCFEQASFDVAYMSEVDPTWQDDTIAAVVYPETAVFAFPWRKSPVWRTASPPRPICRSIPSFGAPAATARCIPWSATSARASPPSNRCGSQPSA